MKNLQISDNDLMGNRFNGHDLHIHLRYYGIESSQLVWKKKSNDLNTFEIGRNIVELSRMNNLFLNIQDDFMTHNTLYPFSYSLLFDKLFLDSDIVHYHLIHNAFFNISHLPILSKLKPSVWTLHDPWALTGHCIHFFDCNSWKTGCGDCPNLEAEFAIRKDSTAINWEIKRIIYESCNMDLIVASKWMYNIVQESPLLQHFDTHLISFGIDQNVFRPIDKKQAKAFLKIPQKNKVIAFRASEWKLKGLCYIKEALFKFEDQNDISLLTSNQIGLVDEFLGKFHIVELGWIFDEEVLRNFYCAADIFLMPSEAESFGMSAIESMACGTPVIAFEDTVLEETIGSPGAGIVVPKGSSVALFMAIQTLFADENQRRQLSDRAMQFVANKYDLHTYLDSIIRLYQQVIDKRSNDRRAAYLVEQMQKIRLADNNHINDVLIGKHSVGRFLIIRISNKLRKFPVLHSLLRYLYIVLLSILKQLKRLCKLLKGSCE